MRSIVIQNRYRPYVFAFFMALLMSCLMSFVITLFNVGLIDNVLQIWLKAWAFAFVVAFPAVILVAPVVHRLVDAVMSD